MTGAVCSMTGFGRGEADAEGVACTVEMRSVNSRYLDVVVRLNRPELALEDRVSRLVQRELVRGRVEVHVELHGPALTSLRASIDKDLALTYNRALKELADALQLPCNVDLSSLLRLPGVVSIEPRRLGVETVWPVVENAVRRALEELVSARRREGAFLATSLAASLQELAGLVEAVEERLPSVVAALGRRLAAILRRAWPDGVPEDGRLDAEAAALAQRCDVSEETVRLRSHIGQFAERLRQGGAVGRSLDFLVQEMLREVHTIGVKAGDADVSRRVVAARAMLERMREQVQNLE
ncbi:MAG: YicC family protein [Clostridia bacterium]|nr:YicC family protein [Clostridia bacterium]